MSKRMVQFSIYRYDPDKDDAPYMQDISVELEPTDRKLLDALTKLKAKDDAISYRRSCREGVCGSDAMNINGKNGLACLTDIDSLKQPIADCCDVIAARSAARAASNRVPPFCCVLMLAERSKKTWTPALGERSITAAPRQCGTASSESKTTDSCRKNSGVGPAVLHAIRLIDPTTGSSWKKSADDMTARRKFGAKRSIISKQQSAYFSFSSSSESPGASW